MSFTNSIKKINLYIKLIVAVLSVFILVSFLQYFKTKGFYGTYNYAQYAFTYQKCGYVTRGLIPSIFQLLHIKNTLLFIFIFTSCQLVFCILFFKIASFNVQLKYTYIVFFFSSLGILHFALDSFRLDIFIYTLCLLVYLSLFQQKIIIAIILSVIAIIIHEAAYFLMVPVFFLFITSNKKRFLMLLFFSVFFLISVISSNLLFKDNAVKLIEDFTNLTIIPEHYYQARISSSIENIKYYFSIFNIKVNISFLVLFILLFVYILTIPLLKKYYVLFFPIFLCFIGVDWYRWIHMVYFLLFLVLITENIALPKSKAKKIILYSYLIGIPVAMYIKGSLIYIIAIKITE